MIDRYTGRKISEKVARKFFFKVDSFEMEGIYATDIPLFITTVANANKRISGQHYSPLLAEDDVRKLQGAFRFNANFNFYFLWTFVVVGVMTALIPVWIDLNLNPAGPML